MHAVDLIRRNGDDIVGGGEGRDLLQAVVFVKVLHHAKAAMRTGNMGRPGEGGQGHPASCQRHDMPQEEIAQAIALRLDERGQGSQAGALGDLGAVGDGLKDFGHLGGVAAYLWGRLAVHNAKGLGRDDGRVDVAQQHEPANKRGEGLIADGWEMLAARPQAAMRGKLARWLAWEAKETQDHLH